MSSSQKKGVYGKVESKASSRWDMEEMERRAKERSERDKELMAEDEKRALGQVTTKKKVVKAAPSEATIKEALSERLVLESAIGRTQVVQGGPDGRAPGFYCKVCDCVLKDSQTYMDHKNGRKHIKNLGLSTKFEREDVSAVIAKMESLKRKAEEPKKDKYDLDARLEAARREEEQEKAEKKKRKKQKQSEKKPDDDEFGGMDPAMAAMMGFSGFGSTKA